MSAAVRRIHGRDDVAFINQHLPARFQRRSAPRAGRVSKALQKLAVLAIAKIETLMPVMRTRQVGAGHYRLGFASLKGEPSSALRLDNGRDRGLAIHLDDGQ